MDWYRIDVDFHRHPKARALARALGEEVSWWRIAQVWAWCVEFAPDGRIETPDPVLDIEDAASWKGELGAFVAACARVELLEKTDAGFRVHDWSEHNGKAIARAEGDIERKRKWREDNKKQHTNGHADATRTPRGRHAERRRTPRVDETRRDETRRDEKQGGGGRPTATTGFFSGVGDVSETSPSADATRTPAPSAAQPDPDFEIPWSGGVTTVQFGPSPTAEQQVWAWLDYRLPGDASPIGRLPEPTRKHLRLLLQALDAHGQELVRKAWVCWLADDWAKARSPPFAPSAFLQAEQLAQFLDRARRAQWHDPPDRPGDFELVVDGRILSALPEPSPAPPPEPSAETETWQP